MTVKRCYSVYFKSILELSFGLLANIQHTNKIQSTKYRFEFNSIVIRLRGFLSYTAFIHNFIHEKTALPNQEYGTYFNLFDVFLNIHFERTIFIFRGIRSFYIFLLMVYIVIYFLQIICLTEDLSKLKYKVWVTVLSKLQVVQY